MYGNGYSMAIVLDHRSTATSLTGNRRRAPQGADVKLQDLTLICFCGVRADLRELCKVLQHLLSPAYRDTLGQVQKK